MPTWNLSTPPTWAKDAVATDRGWVDPKSGDILVSCKRLKDAVSYNEAFGKGVGQKPSQKEKRGGARVGGGRKPDAVAAEIAKEKISNGEVLTKGEANALERVEGVTVDESLIKQPPKKRGLFSRKKKKAKVEVKAEVNVGGDDA